MNGKFVEKYGQTWKDLDPDMKQMAIMSEIYDLRESIEPVSEICKRVERHDLYFKGIWALITLLGIPVILLIIKWIVG